MKKLILPVIFAMSLGAGCSQASDGMEALSGLLMQDSSQNETYPVSESDVTYPGIPEYDCYMWSSGKLYGMNGFTKNEITLNYSFTVTSVYESKYGLVLIGSNGYFYQQSGDVIVQLSERPVAVSVPVISYNTSKWRIEINVWESIYVTDLFNLVADRPADRYYEIQHFCQTRAGAWYSTEKGNGAITRPVGTYYWPDHETAPNHQTTTVEKIF